MNAGNTASVCVNEYNSVVYERKSVLWVLLTHTQTHERSSQLPKLIAHHPDLAAAAAVLHYGEAGRVPKLTAHHSCLNVRELIVTAKEDRPHN